LAYDGSAFFGFQSQKSTSKTVSETVRRAFHRLGIKTPPVGSGRTDRGVHATGQVVHFDLPVHWQNDRQKLKVMLNRLLEPHIQFKHISPVADSFHARFCAKRRIYRYVIKPLQPTPFEAPYCRYLRDLDEERLLGALRLFEGEHDFMHFHKRGSDPKSTVRTIYRTALYTFGNYKIVLFEANGFLRAQVRMMLESSVMAMRGELQESDITDQLCGKITPPLAPPQGLYLSRVIY